MIYSGTIQAKNNEMVPLFASGRPVHSKYNPNGEKTILPQDFSGCAVIAGVGAGFHIMNLLDNQEIQKIIAVESDRESLEFAKTFRCVKSLCENTKVLLCTLEDFEETLISNYFPALYRNLTLSFLRSWENENPKASEDLRNIFSCAIKKISSDYSVQAHFGKLWHKNILENLRFISDHEIHNFNPTKIKTHGKTAAIIAAGPSLEKSMAKLIEDRNRYFIVATDTSYDTLLLNKIIPDAVVSVDAQHVSSEHFFCSKPSETIFVFDICANPEAVRLVYNKGNSIHFIRSGHPLSIIASKTFPLALTQTGSGTVTIAAADWARQTGFFDMEFFGADFSYSDGKPYCRGTYLEKKFLSNSNRTGTFENQYVSLMYRTEIEKVKEPQLCIPGRNAITSEVLKSYGTTLIQWINEHGFNREKNIIRSTINNSSFQIKEIKEFDFHKDFFNGYFSRIKEFYDDSRNSDKSTTIQRILDSPELTSLLPLIASFKCNDLFENISLAYNFLLYYNSLYES